MNIILYTKKGCSWCQEVLELFAQKKVNFEERDCRTNSDFMKELEEKSGQSLTPTLDVDSEILADSDAESIAQFLKVKNHPSFLDS